MNKGLDYLKKIRDRFGKQILESSWCGDSKGYTHTITVNDLCDEIEKELKALEIIKVLFNSRAKLYERNDGIEQVVDKNGNYRKANCVAYVLELWVDDLHYVFHLNREEYELLKEVLL